MQQLSKHIFDYLYVGYGIKRKLLISSMRIIVLFALCRYAHFFAFISVIELPRIPAYCPKRHPYRVEMQLFVRIVVVLPLREHIIDPPDDQQVEIGIVLIVLPYALFHLAHPLGVE